MVEANRLGANSIGFEINPFAALVCRVKLEALHVNLADFRDAVDGYKDFMEYSADYNPRRCIPSGFKSRIPFFSPSVERKVLATLDYIDSLAEEIRDLFKVAFASVMVEFSNYTYEPSLGTRPGAGKQLVLDADVGKVISRKLHDMLNDIAEIQREHATIVPGNQFRNPAPSWHIHERSFFEAEDFLNASSVDLVVTSPPYMNNYHYVRNSRPQLYWTGLVQASSELKDLETGNFGKYWQTVRGDQPIPLTPDLPELQREITEIREINKERGVYGGNGWANYVTAYMNDLDRFCGLLARVLKPGGTAVVVVGNSVVQGREIRVDARLSELAELNGLSTLNIVRLRDRVGTSIVNTGARLSGTKKLALYDAAVAIRRSN